MTKKKKEEPKAKARKKDIEEGKNLAWLSYLGIFLLIPLLAYPENTFCKHHAKQGLVILLLWIGLVILSFIPFINVIGYIGDLILFVIAIIGIIQSLKGHYWKAPFGIFELSQKFKI
ncbi:MAG: hypothetical protein ABIN61_02460 [candidate division WOR-3 bacterium]